MSASPIVLTWMAPWAGALGLNGVAEIGDELGCFLVAVRFGKGGEPGDIGGQKRRRCDRFVLALVKHLRGLG